MAVTLPPFSSSASISGTTQIAAVDEQLNIFMDDVESYMTTSLNSASTQISNEVSSTITNNSVTASRSTATFTTVANTWYRIATSPVDITSNSGVYVVNWNGTGNYGTTRFTASCNYGETTGTSIAQIDYSKYGSGAPTQARIVYHTTYTTRYAYVEILLPAVITNLKVNVELQDAIGWSLVTPSTLGSIPSGYTSYAHTFVNTAITAAGTFTKVTFNKEGRVTSGTSLVVADIPNIDTGKLTTGTLPVARGGTGTTTSTGTGNIVLSTSPTLVTPNIGNATGNLTGTASIATNVAGGALGNIHYQSAANTTATLANGISGQLLKSNGNAAPSWSTLDMSMLPEESFKQSVSCATTATLSVSTATSTVLTGYSPTASINCTSTAGSTTVTGNVTNNIKVGAIVSTATVQLAAGTTVASIVSATSFTVTNRANIPTTSISGSGTQATATFATQTYIPYAVGSTITISGASPTSYNGSFVVTNCTTTSVSWASAEILTATVQGTIAFTIAAGTTIPTIFTQTIAALGAIDGITTTANMRVLIKDQNTLGGLTNAAYAAHNGIFTVTNVGSTSVPWVLTRTSDANSSSKLASCAVPVDAGTANGGTIFYNSFYSSSTLGTTTMPWVSSKVSSYMLTVGSASTGLLSYNGTTSLAGKFDGGGTTPSGTNRLNYGGYFYPAALNLIGTGDTTSTSTHVFVETGTDGFVRPKTLDSFKTEIFASPVLVTPNIGVASGTSFNSITGLSSTLPTMAGVATIGTATTAARADHKHPTDTSRAAYVHNHTTLTGITNLQYDTTNVASPVLGQSMWNSTEYTLDVGLGSAVLQVGQEQLIRVRNTTGSAITNGSAVMANGTVGASGRIAIAPANLTQSNAKQILGIVTETIAAGADGFCTVFGKVRQLNTSGSVYGETWADGDILYVKPSGNGALTKIAPTGSTVKLPVAIVINAHASSGTLFVRVNSIDENHAEPGLATKASLNQVKALALALGLTTEQINTILNSNP